MRGGALLETLDADALEQLRRRFSARLLQVEPGTQKHWTAVTTVLKAEYCAMLDLGETRRLCIRSGRSFLSTRTLAWQQILLIQLWRLAWQEADRAWLDVVANDSRNLPDPEPETARYLRYHDSGVLPDIPTGNPEDFGIQAALWLPVPEARSTVASEVRQLVERAERQRTTPRAVALLGPLVWMRGVVWARRAMTGDDVVPGELGRFFYEG